MIWIEKIQEAINFIEQNLFEQINAETVGKAINYSTSSFSNFFSAVTGYSVGEYIRFRRLSIAAEQLVCKDISSVTEVALECGFETVEAFSKAFKRFFGYSPSQFAESESKYRKFAPISINFSLEGGFSMTRNFIPGLQKVDWSDVQRQNEYVNSVVSSLNGLGENTNYDYVCAMSGSAFRTSFSMQEWNFGNYHASNVPIIIEHTFKMFGYNVLHHKRSNFKTDSQLIIDSIDRGAPVLTFEGVINCADTCLISGYDNDGETLLGFNPFMYIEDDHKEAPDDTGYFRKSDWHNGFFAENNQGSLLIIGNKGEKPSERTVFTETLNLIKRLISEKSLVIGQYNGLAAHKAFANALMTYKWEDNFLPYMCTMCNYKQYLDRQYSVRFFEENNRNDLAELYKQIVELSFKLEKIIPQDFSAGDMFSDKDKLKPYCETLLQICEMEEKALSLIG